MPIYKEIDRFYIGDFDVLVAELEGGSDEVVLMVEGYDLGHNNRFKADTPREELEAAAELLVDYEKGRGL